MKIAICDDDRSILDALERMVRECTDAEVMLFSSAQELLAACGEQRFDLMFLDIMLGSDNGISVAKTVCARQPDARVVFITAHLLDFAEKIFDGVRPYGYIGKPPDKERVGLYIRRAEGECAREGRCLTVSRRGVEYNLSLSGIRYIESEGRRALVHSGSEIISVYERLDNLSHQLDDRFVRCHQSFIVNLEYVTAVEKDSFSVDDNGTSVSVRISRNHLREARRCYFEFKGRTVL